MKIGEEKEKPLGHKRYREKPVTKQERWQYFLDYYLKIVIVAAVAVIILIYILNTTVFNRKEEIFNIMCLENGTELDTEQLETDLKKTLGAESKKEVVSIAAMEPTMNQAEAVIVTRIQARSVDLFIADKADFEEYLKRGYFEPVKDAVPQEILDSLQDGQLVEGALSEWDEKGNETVGKEKKAYGISLEGTSYSKYKGAIKQPVIGIAANAPHLENALAGLQMLINK